MSGEVHELAGTEQLLLPDFIVSLVHKSQPPRGAKQRRRTPTIIKIELSLIELHRFTLDFFWGGVCIHPSIHPPLPPPPVLCVCVSTRPPPLSFSC